MSTAGALRGTRVRKILTALTAAALLGACMPKQMAKHATAGAIEEVKAQNQARPEGPPPMQDLATNITKGTMTELDKPETREQLGRIMDTVMRSAMSSAMGELVNPRGYPRWSDAAHGFRLGGMAPMIPPASHLSNPVESIGPLGMLGGKMAEGFTLGMSRQLQVELGPDGRGPLGQTMAGVMKEATQAAITGATQELVPADCAGMDSRECAERRVRDLSQSAAKGFVDGLGAALKVPLLLAGFVAGVACALVIFLLLRLRRPVLIATDAGPISRAAPSHGA
jgi:hypothetical protein